MQYIKISEGIFLDRPNRFIAKVLINDNVETVHVKNTGRCKELLVQGAKVYMEDFEGRMGSRKLRWSLVAVEKILDDGKKLLINMDSQAPNALIKEEFSKWAELTGNTFKPESNYKNSRFDFSFDINSTPSSGSDNFKKGFLEVKGVTLEDNGVCLFPDAPTERGTKHLNELIDAKKNGYWAGVLFLVQMDGVKYFTPNKKTDPKFTEALIKAQKAGVQILCYECSITPDSMRLGPEVRIKLPDLSK